MKHIKQTVHNNQRGVAVIFVLILIVITIVLLGLIGYSAYQNQHGAESSGVEISQELNQDFSLSLGQTAALAAGNESIVFRFIEMKPASNPNAKCEELCFERLPTIMTELEYAGKTYKGISVSETGNIDMSFEENGAYPLIPYTLKLDGIDFDKQTATVKIINKQFMKVDFGKQFTLKNDGVSTLITGKTGVHVIFGICGSESTCIREIDLYINNEYVEVFPFGLADPKADREHQFASKDGSYIDHGDIRLRLIESDDKTYATFVFEKV